jgi:PiT family inorganic phosphate transporter/sulfate permease
LDPLAVAAIVLGLTLAMNVGGNNSAAEMGPAFGAGVRSKKEAVFLIAIFSMLGALVAGTHVVHTVGSGILPGGVLEERFGAVAIILLSASCIIALANYLRVPVATSHALVGSVVGMGIYYGNVNWGKVGVIAAWWLMTPLVSLGASYLLGRYVYPPLERWITNACAPPTVQRCYRGFITLSGCYMAFSAGSNSLAKAVGPIVGAGILPATWAAVLGGLGMAAGALIVGHRLLQTVGTGITPIDPLKATLIESVCGTIILTASYAGVPVSLAEIVTCAVIGFSCAHTGIRMTAQNHHVRIIYKLWPACPLTTAATSFSIAWLAKTFLTP